MTQAVREARLESGLELLGEGDGPGDRLEAEDVLPLRAAEVGDIRQRAMLAAGGLRTEGPAPEKQARLRQRAVRNPHESPDEEIHVGTNPPVRAHRPLRG